MTSMMRPVKYPPFAVTVDLVVLSVSGDALRVLVVRRGGEPFRGRWALPGGFVQPDEDLEAAARRELAEETGVSVRGAWVEQLASYGAPGRDPRMRTVTVAYLALLPDAPLPQAGTDASDAAWRPVDELLRPRRLAFDHRAILGDGIDRLRAKIEYSPVATALCSPEFTVADLRDVYEVVWGRSLDARNFHRKVTGAAGFLTPTGAAITRGSGRPAQLFRRGPASLLSPPMLRTE